MCTFVNVIRNPHLELLSGSGKGEYTPHCFFIRTSIDADLAPPMGAPSLDALATYAHEYVHMLHNVSTFTGLQLLVANLWILRSLPHATDADGHFRGQDFLNESQKHLVRLSCEWTYALLGSIRWRPGPDGPHAVSRWNFIHTASRSLQLEAPLDHVIDLVCVQGDAVQADGTTHDFSIDVGYDFISEGVAYEVDREIRRCKIASEDRLDAGIPPYPYLAFARLLNYWVGRETTPKERIDLGVYALLSTSPARTLLELCRRLGAQPHPDPSGHVPYVVAVEVINAFRLHALDFFDRSILPEVSGLARSPGVVAAVRQLCDLFSAALHLRIATPVLEHCLAGSYNKHAFLACVASLVDCCVIQSKASGIFGGVSWIGPGLLARDQNSVENLVRLQAAIHFAQRHMGHSGLAATRQLRSHQCPFSGNCQTQYDDNYPTDCDSQPWNRFLGKNLGDRSCWYAAGVKMLSRFRAANHATLWI
jgi:hypothetical protein